jgi:ubiquitin C-terminal hydrolase
VYIHLHARYIKNYEFLIYYLQVVVGQYKLQFESYDQQDSHEFLMFLLDWMHNDLKQVCTNIYNTNIILDK